MFLLLEGCAVLLGLLSGEEVLQFVSATVALEADRGIEDNLIFCLFKVDCIGVDEMLGPFHTDHFTYRHRKDTMALLIKIHNF
jgi:hypothetical protein